MVTPVVRLQKSCGEFIHALSFGELFDQKDTRFIKIHGVTCDETAILNNAQHCHMKAAKSALSSDSGRQPPTIVPRSQCPGLPWYRTFASRAKGAMETTLDLGLRRFKYEMLQKNHVFEKTRSRQSDGKFFKDLVWRHSRDAITCSSLGARWYSYLYLEHLGTNLQSAPLSLVGAILLQYRQCQMWLSSDTLVSRWCQLLMILHVFWDSGKRAISNANIKAFHNCLMLM